MCIRDSTRSASKAQLPFSFSKVKWSSQVNEIPLYRWMMQSEVGVLCTGHFTLLWSKKNFLIIICFALLMLLVLCPNLRWPEGKCCGRPLYLCMARGRVSISPHVLWPYGCYEKVIPNFVVTAMSVDIWKKKKKYKESLLKLLSLYLRT